VAQQLNPYALKRRTVNAATIGRKYPNAVT
jgi:hypothetical protein